MPVADTKQDESSHDSTREDRDKDRDRTGKPKGPAKTKDLSHVPCKFFRVGSCTAGSSCPFSHNILEPGQQKEVCAWFVKGNCKFGHKCALAHILPGQNMSMDRKNKKAAQVAANAGSGSGRDGKEGRDAHKGGRAQKNASQGQSGGSRSALLSGSTAPTRSLSSSSRGPMPMPMKSALSPSAPAPPVKDTDFVSFGLPDESNKLPSAPAQTKSSSTTSLTDTPSSSQPEEKTEAIREGEKQSPSPLPTSIPRRNGLEDQGSSIDFGPIGSPPRVSQSAAHVSRVNGFSPGTSPQVAPVSTSPFSAPGTQTNFMIHDQIEAASDLKARSGISASLGAMITTWSTDRTSVSQLRKTTTSNLSGEIVVEDEDLEEFIPGSLSDLLTPEERSRRFSRTAVRPSVAVGDRDPGGAQQSGVEGHHRYSRSVPAPSLLQDIRSIWSENGGIPGSADTGASITSGGLGNGTPSSFQSNNGFVSRLDEMLAPSNASAAFLPGLHQYINAKRPTPGMSTLYPHASGSHQASGAYTAGLNGVALSPPRMSSFTGRSGFDATPSDPYLSQGRPLSGRPLGHDAYVPEAEDRRSALSPSTRALQAHAPGQSLPQGLAAGYSRIHALPPPVIPSPSTSGAFSPGRPNGFMTGAAKGLGQFSNVSGDWHSMSPSAGSVLDQPPTSHGVSANVPTASSPSLGGLETMFSRLSYSAAAARPSPAAPPGIGARNPSGGRWNNGQGPLSPLSGPVLTGDDDDLFSMDG